MHEYISVQKLCSNSSNCDKFYLEHENIGKQKFIHDEDETSIYTLYTTNVLYMCEVVKSSAIQYTDKWHTRNSKQTKPIFIKYKEECTNK